MGAAKNITFDAIKNGDKKSFERIFKSLYKPLVQYAFRITRSHEEAEGIVQQIFLSMWEKRKGLNVEGPLENYLFRATRNRCINYVKLELPKRQQLETLENLELTQKNIIDTFESENVLSKKVAQAIEQLPVKCKEIFVLSRYGGLTYKEIAEELDLSVKTVENQMSIALKKLRESLKEFIKKN